MSFMGALMKNIQRAHYILSHEERCVIDYDTKQVSVRNNDIKVTDSVTTLCTVPAENLTKNSSKWWHFRFNRCLNQCYHIRLIDSSGTKFNSMWNKLQQISLTKMHLKTLSAKWRPVYLHLNMVTQCIFYNCPPIALDVCVGVGSLSAIHMHMTLKCFITWSYALL